MVDKTGWRTTDGPTDRLRLGALGLIAVAAMLLLFSPAAIAARDANNGLPEGVPVPAWSKEKAIHFLPTVQASEHSAQLRAKTFRARGLAGRRCEAGYCPSPPLNYYGGQVQENPAVHLILWGNNWNSPPGNATGAALLTLYPALSQSGWQMLLSQYYDTARHVGSEVSLAGAYVDTSIPAPTGVTSQALVEELNKAIALNGWAKSGDAQFVVAPAPGSTYDASFAGSFCAFHSFASGVSWTFVPYVGDEPFRQNCIGYDPHRIVTRVETMLASHEYAESATDPNPGQAAWLTSDGYEVSDICSSGIAPGPSGFSVTENWDNNLNECALTDSPQQPHAVIEGSGKLDLFWRNHAGALEYTNSQDEGATWTTPISLGGAPIAGEPSAAETSPGHLAVFWRNGSTGSTQGNLMEITYNGVAWGSVQNLGMGKLGGDPRAIAESNGNVDVFWRGGNAELWHATNSSGPWIAEHLGGSLSSNPSPTKTSSGVVDVFWKGTDNSLWHSWRIGTTWYGPQSLGMGPLGSGPSATGETNGVVDVFWRGTNTQIWHAWFTGMWHGPESPGGQAEWEPTSAATGLGNVEVWYRGTNSDLWHSWFEASKLTWYGPGDFGNPGVGSQPQAVSLADHHPSVYWTAPDLNGVFMERFNGTWKGPTLVSPLH
jgi:hypothetical protein